MISLLKKLTKSKQLVELPDFTTLFKEYLGEVIVPNLYDVACWEGGVALEAWEDYEPTMLTEIATISSFSDDHELCIEMGCVQGENTFVVTWMYILGSHDWQPTADLVRDVTHWAMNKYGN